MALPLEKMLYSLKHSLCWEVNRMVNFELGNKMWMVNLSTWHERGTKKKFQVSNRNLTHDLPHCAIYNYCLFGYLFRTTPSYVGLSYYFTFRSSISLLLGNAWHNLPWYMYCLLMVCVSSLLPVPLHCHWLGCGTMSPLLFDIKWCGTYLNHGSCSRFVIDLNLCQVWHSLCC